MRILVVDDEKDVELLFRQHFRKELRAGEIQLSFAFSAEDALEQMHGPGGTEIVLILSDINMPGLNGLDLLTGISVLALATVRIAEPRQGCNVFRACSTFDPPICGSRAPGAGLIGTLQSR
jgi:CheY-like chemotaxis protein